MAATNAAKNRKIRQEALRDQLQAQGHVQHVVDIAQKMREQALDLEATHIQAYKAAADIHMKLINKYLPDLKQVDCEITGEDGNPIEIDHAWEIKVVG